jgi:hypothetical protein
MINPRSLLDPERISIAGCIHAEMKAKWFNRVLSRLQSRVEGEIHPVYVIFIFLVILLPLAPRVRLAPNTAVKQRLHG